jgi:hypothetical protein
MDPLVSISVNSSDLFNDDIDLVSVFHVEFLGGLSFVETFSVEEEPDVGKRELKSKYKIYALPLAVGIHEFLELSGTFDLEEDFFPVLGLDLEIELLCAWSGF